MFSVTIEDSLAAKRKRRAEYTRAWRANRRAAGLCERCGASRGAGRDEKVLCARCSRGCAEAYWRREQRRPAERKGPAPTITPSNFATDDLIAAHIPMARKMAYRAYSRIPPSSSVDVDDVVGDALYGLVLAGRTHDETRSAAPFAAYAAIKIRGSIYNGIRRWTHGWQKRPPALVPFCDDPRERYFED